MSIKRRLSGLEKVASEAAEPEPPWPPPEVYDRLREDAQDSIDSDLAIGEEPLYWIDDEGRIRASDDDSFVRHEGDYIRAIDREIARLRREIAEEEASMTPEELARKRARQKEDDARLAGLSLDEHIEAVEAEIAALNAALKAEEGGGGGR